MGLRMGVHRKIRFLGGSRKPLHRGELPKKGHFANLKGRLAKTIRVVFLRGDVDTPMEIMRDETFLNFVNSIPLYLGRFLLFFLVGR